MIRSFVKGLIYHVAVKNQVFFNALFHGYHPQCFTGQTGLPPAADALENLFARQKKRPLSKLFSLYSGSVYTDWIYQ